MGLCVNGWLFGGLLLIVLSGCIYEWYRMQRTVAGMSFTMKISLGLIYIALAIASMVYLGGYGEKIMVQNYNPLLPCAVIFSMWINDTMAYIVGSLIGKTPFSPISPKKTWEGTIGGALLCTVCVVLLGITLPIASPIQWPHWLMIGMLCAITGTLGDLLESKMKRMAGVKDSGSIMPGHGGFLDRFDSMLMAAPVVAIYVWLFLS
jgi:phosphatidate cytidylyltransferase